MKFLNQKGKRMKYLLIAVVILTTGCASKPEDIMATPYPDAAYDKFTCDQLNREQYKIQNQVYTLTGQQRADRKKDQTWGWAGALIFAPAVFLMDGNSETAIQLATLKGKFESIKRVVNRRRC